MHQKILTYDSPKEGREQKFLSLTLSNRTRLPVSAHAAMRSSHRLHTTLRANQCVWSWTVPQQAHCNAMPYTK
jgi:hypothetical protein